MSDYIRSNENSDDLDAILAEVRNNKLRDENEVIEEIDFPGNIHVISEVTNDYAYQNYSLALFMPEED